MTDVPIHALTQEVNCRLYLAEKPEWPATTPTWTLKFGTREAALLIMEFALARSSKPLESSNS